MSIYAIVVLSALAYLCIAAIFFRTLKSVSDYGPVHDDIWVLCVEAFLWPVVIIKLVRGKDD